MKQRFITTAEKWLLGHLKKHTNGDDSFELTVVPKIEHCQEVAKYCRMLAEELHWSKDDTIAAQVIGMLHDVGRVTQFTEFGTFIDDLSIDHGKRGYDIVSKSKILSKFKTGYERIILEGIRYHNSSTFRQKAHKGSIPFIKLIRDADKLEKYKTTGDYIDKKISSGKKARVLSKAGDGPITPKVIAVMLKRRKVAKKHINSTIDFYLFKLSWLFDVHYPQTYQRIWDSGIVKKIIRFLPDTKELRETLEGVRKHLKKNIEHR